MTRHLPALAWSLLAVFVGYGLGACTQSVWQGGEETAYAPAPPTVRVGLSCHLGVGEVVIGSQGPMRMSAGGEFVELPAGEVRVAPDAEGLRAGGVLATAEVRFASAGSDPLWIGSKDREYLGEIVARRRDGGLDVVNEVGMEPYLASVIGGEMGSGWPDEALKAQVVAARSYAMACVADARAEGLHPGFDVYDDERSQVYRGVEAQSATTSRLVEETRGMILTWEGKGVKAFYHSTCGGKTEAAENVLEWTTPIPPLSGATCGGCDDSPHARWEARVPGVREFEILEWTPAGRALRVRVNGQEMHANLGFRRQSGARSVKSSWWDRAEVTGGELRISGRGWGHGAGLCQFGARGWARRGEGFEAILARYYPGARLVKVY